MLSDALKSLIAAKGYTTAEQIKSTVYGQFNDPRGPSMKDCRRVEKLQANDARIHLSEGKPPDKRGKGTVWAGR